MVTSTHKCEVIPVKLEPHPNADNLAVCKVYNYRVCVNKNDWKDGDLGAYVVPDSLVDTSRPEFSFLGKNNRIRVKKLRGVPSQGLLVKAPEGSQPGDDVASLLGVTRYNPPEPGSPGKPGLFLGGETESGPPNLWCPKYDLESWYRYGHVFRDGEPVVATEKLHGAGAKYTWKDGRLYCGSRNEWKRQYPSYSRVTMESLVPKVGEERAREILDRIHNKPVQENLWWKVIARYPDVVAFLQAHEGLILYGEVFGQVQDLKYGAKPGECFFAAFDLWDSHRGQFLDWVEFKNLCNQGIVPYVPFLGSFPYDRAAVEKLIGGDSYEAAQRGITQLREGIVIKPLRERYHEDCGRVALKAVSDDYLERAK